jgi:hypothetical protein
MLNVDEFKKVLVNNGCKETYNNYIIGGSVWYFENSFRDHWFSEYNSFKLYISNVLNMHYNDIAIAGSAKLGFSINPKKDFKIFNESSDIDIIIISHKLFIKFWNSYLQDSINFYIRDYDHVCSAIFKRFIIFNGFTLSNDVYADWERLTNGFEKNLQLRFKISNEIHYRIFDSWDAAEIYYLKSLDDCRAKLLEGK